MRGAALASLHREVWQSFPNKGTLRQRSEERQEGAPGLSGEGSPGTGTDSKCCEEASELKWRDQGGKWPVMSSEGGVIK